MAKKILWALVSKDCLRHFTWSGKSGIKGGRKAVFKQLKNLHDVIIAALKKLDENYNSETFKNDMVKHVLKYAYLKDKDKESVKIDIQEEKGDVPIDIHEDK